MFHILAILGGYEIISRSYENPCLFRPGLSISSRALPRKLKCIQEISKKKEVKHYKNNVTDRT